jgi:hypothetical protein
VSNASSVRFSLYVRFGGLGVLCAPFQTVQKCRYVKGRLGCPSLRDINLDPPAPLLLRATALLCLLAHPLLFAHILTHQPQVVTHRVSSSLFLLSSFLYFLLSLLLRPSPSTIILFCRSPLSSSSLLRSLILSPRSCSFYLSTWAR